MNNLKVAIATDDKKNLTPRHFGEANYYYLIELKQNKHKKIGIINNSSWVEDISKHADKKKAKSVMKLLSSKGINVLAAQVFGPNIVRVRKKFACCVVKKDTVDELIEILKGKYHEINKEYRKGESREHLTFV